MTRDEYNAEIEYAVTRFKRKQITHQQFRGMLQHINRKWNEAHPLNLSGDTLLQPVKLQEIEF